MTPLVEFLHSLDWGVKPRPVPPQTYFRRCNEPAPLLRTVYPHWQSCVATAAQQPVQPQPEPVPPREVLVGEYLCVEKRIDEMVVGDVWAWATPYVDGRTGAKLLPKISLNKVIGLNPARKKNADTKRGVVIQEGTLTSYAAEWDKARVMQVVTGERIERNDGT